MCDLQLRALAAQHRIILAPVKLECLTRTEGQWNEYAAPRGLLFTLPIRPPIARKSRDPTVGAGKAEGHQIGMKLLQRPALLARLPGLSLQPARQLVRKRVKLARSGASSSTW